MHCRLITLLTVLEFLVLLKHFAVAVVVILERFDCTLLVAVLLCWHISFLHLKFKTLFVRVLIWGCYLYTTDLRWKFSTTNMCLKSNNFSYGIKEIAFNVYSLMKPNQSSQHRTNGCNKCSSFMHWSTDL